MENWYLLYDGESVDGMGKPDYLTRTTDKKVALEHYKKCKENPYSIGKVVVITDDKQYMVFMKSDLK